VCGEGMDGSREAVRAVPDALPLLHRSQSVHIVQINPFSAEDEESDTQSLLTPLAFKTRAPVRQIKTVEDHALEKRIGRGLRFGVMGLTSPYVAGMHPQWCYQVHSLVIDKQFFVHTGRKPSTCRFSRVSQTLRRARAL
jgi:hypothetical protein